MNLLFFSFFFPSNLKCVAYFQILKKKHQEIILFGLWLTRKLIHSGYITGSCLAVLDCPSSKTSRLQLPEDLPYKLISKSKNGFDIILYDIFLLPYLLLVLYCIFCCSELNTQVFWIGKYCIVIIIDPSTSHFPPRYAYTSYTAQLHT